MWRRVRRNGTALPKEEEIKGNHKHCHQVLGKARFTLSSWMVTEAGREELISTDINFGSIDQMGVKALSSLARTGSKSHTVGFCYYRLVLLQFNSHPAARVTICKRK